MNDSHIWRFKSPGEFERDSEYTHIVYGLSWEISLKMGFYLTFARYNCAYLGSVSRRISSEGRLAVTTHSFLWRKRDMVEEPHSAFPLLTDGTDLGQRIRRRLGSKRSRNILVVDDDNAVRELMAMILEADGYTVLRARHSQEALFFNSEFQGQIHLLLTDYRMKPFENGLELARKVRATRPDIKVVFASEYVGNDNFQDEIESTTSIFLAKPFSPAGLLECVRQCLDIPA